MSQPTVRDFMTTDLITAPDESSLGDVAAMLSAHRISAVPVVDRYDVAVGIVSWTDIGETIEREEPRSPTTRGWPLRRGRPRSRWRDRAVTEVMTAPPVTIGPDASLPAAGRVMHHRGVGRLLVVDHGNRLVGVVTRRDLLKIYGRLDAVVRDEVSQRVLRRTLRIPSGAVRVAVHDGVVTLTGRVDSRSTVLAAVSLTEAVAGVTGVVDGLAFDTDDTAEPLPDRPAAALGRGFAAYAARVTR